MDGALLWPESLACEEKMVVDGAVDGRAGFVVVGREEDKGLSGDPERLEPTSAVYAVFRSVWRLCCYRVSVRASKNIYLSSDNIFFHAGHVEAKILG